MKEQNKMVIHPAHYNKEGRKECWDEMEEIFGGGIVAIWDCLNAYKYYYRAGNKDGNPEEQDIQKIENYMGHAAKTIAISDGQGVGIAKGIFKKMLEILEEEQ